MQYPRASNRPGRFTAALIWKGTGVAPGDMRHPSTHQSRALSVNVYTIP